MAMVGDAYTATNTSNSWCYSGTSPCVLSDGTGISIKWAVTGDSGTTSAMTVPIRAYKSNYTYDDVAEAWYEGMANDRAMRQILDKGKAYRLPDGSMLNIDDAGNYQIEDKDAKVTYKANRVREFSPHLNASDMLAQFVKYVGSLGVKQSEVLGLPLELFINWLIIEAAERDQDPVPGDVVPVQQHPALKAVRKPTCRACGKFIPLERHKLRFPFCDPMHAERYIEKHRLRIKA